MLPKDIATALSKYISGATEASGPLPEFDFDEVSALLGAGLGEKQVATLAKAMGDDPLQATVLASAQRIVQTANGHVPRPTRQTALGMVPTEPGSRDVADFARGWSVAADPQVVFRDMLEGSLSPDMIAAFKTSWPSLDALTQELIPRVVSDVRSKRTKDPRNPWQVDSRRDQMLAVMMGRGASPAQLAVAQALQSLSATPTPATRPPTGPQAPQDEQLGTPTARGESEAQG